MPTFTDQSQYRQLDHDEAARDARVLWGAFLAHIEREGAKRGLSPSEFYVAEHILRPTPYSIRLLQLFASYLGSVFTDSPLQYGVDVLIGNAASNFGGPSRIGVDGNGKMVIHINKAVVADWNSLVKRRKINAIVLQELAHGLYHWDDSDHPLRADSEPGFFDAPEKYQDLQAAWWATCILSLCTGAVLLDRSDDSPCDTTLAKLLDP